ncbi:VQ motif-containing protein 11-like [Chenopodium quinoa]|uniref:VQ motif-containing protein 11-like n=1 Tax=Chenopodium quinoa TaxID=63459 RepID=UPI000B77AB07|nr:VQ motif-containing protein 11-like [Chenopodium quinoa]
MGSNTTNNNNNKQQHSMHYSTYESSSTTNNTTFVQADPSNFRAIVQQLTGSHMTASSSQGGSVRRDGSDGAGFKLHERRQQQGAIRKLEMIELNNNSNSNSNNSNAAHNYNNHHGPLNGHVRVRGGHDVAMVSPVSTLDGLSLGIRSPRTNPRSGSSMSEEEERVVIAEKGFYLHPVSPLSGGSRDFEPRLLPLFPLHSPRDNGQG